MVAYVLTVAVYAEGVATKPAFMSVVVVPVPIEEELKWPSLPPPETLPVTVDEFSGRHDCGACRCF
jgi:hypothetical protein